MDDPRPYFYYLFQERDDIKIKKITDTETEQVWSRGQRWIDAGFRTREEAQAKRLLYLSERPS